MASSGLYPTRTTRNAEVDYKDLDGLSSDDEELHAQLFAAQAAAERDKWAGKRKAARGTGARLDTERMCQRVRAAAPQGAQPRRLRAQDVSLEGLRASGVGFREPILVAEGDGGARGMGMALPDDQEALTLQGIVRAVGGEYPVQTIECATQDPGPRQTLAQFAAYLETPIAEREQLLNCVSLPLHGTSLDEAITIPRLVRELDLVGQVWPTEDDAPRAPTALLYALLSPAGAYTDFHVDFGGSSVWYHVLKGRKTFVLAPPSAANHAAFEAWAGSARQASTFYADNAHDVMRVEVGPGDTVFLPGGWPHAVSTDEDSVVIGGNFLHGHDLFVQLAVWNMEDRLRVKGTFRYPRYRELMWFAGVHYGKQLRAAKGAKLKLTLFKRKDKEAAAEGDQSGGDEKVAKLEEGQTVEPEDPAAAELAALLAVAADASPVRGAKEEAPEVPAASQAPAAAEAPAQPPKRAIKLKIGLSSLRGTGDATGAPDGGSGGTQGNDVQDGAVTTASGAPSADASGGSGTAPATVAPAQKKIKLKIRTRPAPEAAPAPTPAPAVAPIAFESVRTKGADKELEAALPGGGAAGAVSEGALGVTENELAGLPCLLLTLQRWLSQRRTGATFPKAVATEVFNMLHMELGQQAVDRGMEKMKEWFEASAKATADEGAAAREELEAAAAEEGGLSRPGGLAPVRVKFYHKPKAEGDGQGGSPTLARHGFSDGPEWTPPEQTGSPADMRMDADAYDDDFEIKAKAKKGKASKLKADDKPKPAPKAKALSKLSVRDRLKKKLGVRGRFR
jgi:hypothetical protein